MNVGVTIFRYLPTKSNRETWKLEKEVRSLILKVVKERKEGGASENDLLDMNHMILGGATNDETDRFIVDKCKNIYLAGYETTAVSGTCLHVHQPCGIISLPFLKYVKYIYCIVYRISFIFV